MYLYTVYCKGGVIYHGHDGDEAVTRFIELEDKGDFVQVSMSNGGPEKPIMVANDKLSRADRKQFYTKPIFQDEDYTCFRRILAFT